jgi:hypothetical protein
MDLPDVKAGMAILAEHIQRINASIRQTRVRPGIGYTVKESSGGTSLVINQPLLGGGGNAGPCPFKVTDVSEANPNGGLLLKIQVSQDPIIGTANDDYPDGRYPEGMSSDPDAPAYKLEIEQSAGTEYVYVNIQVDQTGAILSPSTAITVSSEPEFSTGNSTYQKFLIAVVEKVLDDDNQPYISQITNTCPIVYAQPAPPCPFLVEDDSRDGEVRVTVRSGLVDNALPDDMTLTDTFTLTLATTQTFWVIYCGMVVENGVIQTDPGNITIFSSESYESNTATYAYFKLAELTLSQRANGDWYASYILNTCAVPFLTGGGTPCPYFAVSDATDGSTLRVKVAQNQIAGRWPQGMGPSNPNFYLVISQTCYIYAAILWNIQSLTIDSSPSAITILQSNDLLPNTDTMQYILISTVTVGGNPEAITKIVNVCSQPQPNPCLLDWST